MEVRVPVAAGTLWAEDSGSDRTPLVLIHADLTDWGIWDPVIPLVRDRYRVIRYDLRGFGRSSRPEQPFTRLGDLRAVLDHFGIGEAVAVGHSGGGGTALGLAALHHPGRVRGLILSRYTRRYAQARQGGPVGLPVFLQGGVIRWVWPPWLTRRRSSVTESRAMLWLSRYVPASPAGTESPGAVGVTGPGRPRTSSMTLRARCWQGKPSRLLKMIRLVSCSGKRA
ncbi:MAG TPA: alpha/beta fold hydrolase [Trebonia sp.]|nr:alpha/beta fold hydrolase [Trebonia sp.]